MENFNPADIASTEAVRIVGEFYDDFRATMQTLTRLEAVLFFATMSYRGEAHVRPIVMPARIANRLMSELSKHELMGDDQLADYIAKVFRLMQVNSVVPCPIEFHVRLLEMFERIAINGMQNHKELLAQLEILKPGDLTVLSFDMNEDCYTSGIRVVHDALSVHEQNLSVAMPVSHAVH